MARSRSPPTCRRTIFEAMRNTPRRDENQPRPARALALPEMGRPSVGSSARQPPPSLVVRGTRVNPREIEDLGLRTAGNIPPSRPSVQTILWAARLAVLPRWTVLRTGLSSGLAKGGNHLLWAGSPPRAGEGRTVPTR